ncbi:anti-sigma factor [soil metagenome]
MIGNDDQHQRNEPHELLELYVLDLLDMDEVARFERVLDDAPDVRERVRELRGVAAMMALELDPVAPSPDLKTRILDSARADLAETPPAPTDLAAERAWRAGRGDGAWFPWAVAAVLAVALVASVAWILQLRNALDDRPQIERYTVASVDSGPSVTGELVMLGEEEAFLALSGLSQLEAGRVYQVWLIADNHPQSAGTFLPDLQGAAGIIVHGDVASSQLVAITIEPEGGSPQPTSDPIVVGELNG